MKLYLRKIKRQKESGYFIYEFFYYYYLIGFTRIKEWEYNWDCGKKIFFEDLDHILYRKK